MRYWNDKQTFGFELDSYRLYLHITTYQFNVTIWLYLRWFWDVTYKSVKWCFYHKIKASFGCFGIEWIDNSKKTFREGVESKSWLWELF